MRVAPRRFAGLGINGCWSARLADWFSRVGGTAAFVNTFELRTPAPTLPYLGNSLSFVIFHDMGNVFQNASDMFPSFLHYKQPDHETCDNHSGMVGTCSFNFFSQDIGLGGQLQDAEWARFRPRLEL